MNFQKMSTFLLFMCLLLVNNACKKEGSSNSTGVDDKKVSSYSNTAVWEWNELFLKIEQ